ncbi:DUF6274 family protein [Streptomyces sp. NPDC059454]|jgi:hypothetical protein|uniref:DUF6274 family protein n=1 Tax=Streptomyces sp. NPDC059454 TaxID=3346836 RepID=UPI00367A7DFA
MAASAEHETRAPLRAHPSAASSYRHFTRNCPIRHRLLRPAPDSAPRPSNASPPAGEQAGPRTRSL